MRRTSIPLLAVALSSCGPVPRSAATDAVPTAAPSVAVMAPTVELRPEPAAGPSPFVKVATLPADVELHVIDGSIVFVTTHTREGDESPTMPMLVFSVYELGESTLTLVRRFEDRANYGFTLDFVVGSSEGPIDLVGHFILGRGTNLKAISARGGDPYVPATFGGWVHAARAGSELVGAYHSDVSRLAVMRGRRKFQLTSRPPSCPPNASDLRMTSIDEIFGLPGGQLLVSGEGCDGAPLTELFDADADVSKVIDLGTDVTLTSTGRRLLCSSKAGTTEHDGKTCARPLPALPDPGRHEYLAAGDRIFAVADGELLAREADAWRPIPLPPSVAKPFTDGLHLWAISPGADATKILYRMQDEGRPPLQVVDVSALSGGDPAPIAVKSAPFEPAGPDCKTNLVVLYGFTKVTPDDFDFPLTRKALRGHTELEGTVFVVSKDRLGSRFFVAKAPSFELAKALAAIVRAGVAGSSPQIVCQDVDVVREIKLDLRTGNVAG